uniref:Uncharacterized protein n=1 Tax=uncultured marine microorganism HF4000_APKG2H5 TaxID=455545 RepID=B3T6G9_9ZZZZ|nr:hypothetical protein ALOHA_HF4000APKG2H5ctg1g24 [uncultured marine microorganism HF4000_APKG2H5]
MRTCSDAINPRIKVFHLALRFTMLSANSTTSIESPTCVNSASVTNEAERASASSCVSLSTSLVDSLFLGVIQFSLSEFSLVVQCRLLSDNRHVSSGSALQGTPDNPIVGIGGPSKGLPDSSGECVAALPALPDSSRLATNFLVLAGRAGIVAGLLLEYNAGPTSNTHAITGAETRCCTCLLGPLCHISQPPRLCSPFHGAHCILIARAP